MAELGLLAAVVQVIDVGMRVSVNLYKFGQTVACADQSILLIYKDISHACSILKTLAHCLENHREENLYSHNAINTADTIVKECLEVFRKMDGALRKRTSRMGLAGGSRRAATVALERLKWPFLKPKMMLLWSKLDRLKSSLQLLLSVLIYARLTVERSEPSSVTSDHRFLIQRFPHTRAPQSPDYGTSNPPMARNGHSIDLSESSSATELRVCSLDTVTGVAGSSIKGPHTRQMTARESKTTTTTVERYCAFVEWLMEKIEANDHGIGHDMRCRIKDDVMRIHKREVRMLEAAYGHRKLKDLMCGKMWRLAEMDDEQEAARDPSTIVHSGTDNLPAVFQTRKCDLTPSTNLQNLGSHGCGAANRLRDLTASQMQRGGSVSSSRRRVFKANIAIDRFLEERDDPWHLESSAPECSQCDNTDISKDGSWLPFQGLGTSTVVSNRSHKAVPIPSFEDLPALTDSSDSETFVSARSVVDEHAFDSHSPFLTESETDGPLVVINDHRYDEILEQDGGGSRVASMYKEQLAA